MSDLFHIEHIIKHAVFQAIMTFVDGIVAYFGQFGTFQKHFYHNNDCLIVNFPVKTKQKLIQMH